MTEQHWTSEIDSSLLVTYTHSPGRKDRECHTGPYGSCTWEQTEQSGLWEEGFSIKRGGIIPVSMGGCFGLSE